jgi:predicted nucleic acid-binding protein
VNLVDTSVLVAAFGRWHERHEDARAAVQRADAVAAHAALETYAVLTAMPPPRRAPGGLVVEFLAAHFPAAQPDGQAGRTGWLAPQPEAYRGVLAAMAERGLIGGAVFDGLIAATAQSAGATLLTLDQRAAGTYRAVGASFELV